MPKSYVEIVVVVVIVIVDVAIVVVVEDRDFCDIISVSSNFDATDERRETPCAFATIQTRRIGETHFSSSSAASKIELSEIPI